MWQAVEMPSKGGHARAALLGILLSLLGESYHTQACTEPTHGFVGCLTSGRPSGVVLSPPHCPDKKQLIDVKDFFKYTEEAGVSPSHPLPLRDERYLNANPTCFNEKIFKSTMSSQMPS